MLLVRPNGLFGKAVRELDDGCDRTPLSRRLAPGAFCDGRPCSRRLAFELLHQRWHHRADRCVPRRLLRSSGRSRQRAELRAAGVLRFRHVCRRATGGEPRNRILVASSGGRKSLAASFWLFSSASILPPQPACLCHRHVGFCHHRAVDRNELDGGYPGPDVRGRRAARDHFPRLHGNHAEATAATILFHPGDCRDGGYGVGDDQQKEARPRLPGCARRSGPGCIERLLPEQSC